MSPVIAQYHVREYGGGYDLPTRPRKAPTRPTFVGGKGHIIHGKGGKRKVHPMVNYVTPPSTSYGKPVKELYKPAATSHYEKPSIHSLGSLDLGAHDNLEYDLGNYASDFGNFGKEYAGRVRVQVSYYVFFITGTIIVGFHKSWN